MERRNFLKSAAMAGGAAALSGIGATAMANDSTAQSNSAKFKLKYAPGIYSFSDLVGNRDMVDNLKFISDQGFRAVFENGFPGMDNATQEKLMNELSRLGMDFGPYVLYADFGTKSMVIKDEEKRKMLIETVQRGVEIGKRTGAKKALMVPGRYDERLSWDYQTANVIDCLRELSAIALDGGMMIVLEPLNPYDHPGLFLSGMPQAYMVCRAVNSPACKIVDDLYHQQITEGNLIPNMRMSWSEIGTFHCGDNPGRREPGSGEINYRNVFKFIHDQGYDGCICMEHGVSKRGKEGAQLLIDAYRAADNF